jgi:calcineurin-like phosphoesterase family protein
MIKTLYPKFQHWSKTGKIALISDLHLNDFDCKLMDKNWISIEEQQKILKKSASKTDTLILLGDIGDKQYLKNIWLKNKKPYIVVILGNHDAPGQFNNDDFFDEVYDGPLFISKKILLSHEPIDFEFALNIHGHNHSGKMYDGNKINLAANVCNYTPVSLSNIIKSGILKNIKDIHRITIDKAINKEK